MTPPLRLILALALMAGLSSAALAQDRRDRHERDGRHGLVLDQRHRLDHYYPPRGYLAPGLPAGSLSIGFGGRDNYFFHGGVWFRPQHGRFMVVLPPMGITVPMLPSAYATLWIAGAPYYYANGVYYAAAPGQGYVVVAPPQGIDAVEPVPPVLAPKPLPQPIVYPRNGQSAAQTESDQQECNRWATSQAGAMADASVFQRAVSACLDGRGYTVR